MREREVRDQLQRPAFRRFYDFQIGSSCTANFSDTPEPMARNGENRSKASPLRLRNVKL